MRLAAKALLGGIVVGAAALSVYALGVRPWQLHWGAGAAEAARALPGDDLVPSPTLSTTRAITIHARPDQIWPWLLQIGYGRGGFYSYDSLERIAGLRGIVSAERIVPEWQQVAAGNTIQISPVTPMDVAVCDPGRALVLHTVMNPLTAEVADPRAGGLYLDWSWAFLLEPIDAATTRLIIRVRGYYQPRWLAPLFYAAVEPAHFIMERKMLLGLKQRAEAPALEGA